MKVLGRRGGGLGRRAVVVSRPVAVVAVHVGIIRCVALLVI